MGLLERFLNNGSSLDIETPSVGGGPINDPASGFVQTYLPNNTYESTTVGQPDNGSELSTTLNQTALDTSDPNYVGPTLPPNINTQYPDQAHGEFGGAPSQFTQQWNATNTYLSYISSIVDSANDIQVQTLTQTNLDTDTEGTSNIPSPLGYQTSYPEQTHGEFGGAPSQFDQNWSVNNQYISNYNPNAQVQTLTQTNLDTDAQGNSNVPNPLNINTPITPTIPSLNVNMGEFGGAPSQFVQTYSPSNTYLNNLPSVSPQENTLAQTGLDNTDPTAEPTTLINTPTIPDTITSYPPLASGEFENGSEGFTQPWNPNNTYLDNLNPNTQVNTLTQTNLDTDGQGTSNVPNPLAPGVIPDLTPNHELPNGVYMGEFGGAPSQFDQNWSVNNQYISNYNPNIQIDTLTQTALDNTELQQVNTNINPLDIDTPITPQIMSPNINMGEFANGPSQFAQTYGPDNLYLETINNISIPENNTQVQTLTQTNLDTDAQGNSNIPNPLDINIPTTPAHPLSKGVFMGEYYSSNPSQFTQNWSVNNMYLDNVDYGGRNPQIQSLKDTGLDVENERAQTTAENFAPVIPDNTPYPLEATGRNGYFKQEWTPKNGYWRYYLGNRQKFNTGPIGVSSAYSYETNPKLRGNFAFGSNAANFIKDAVSSVKNIF